MSAYPRRRVVNSERLGKMIVAQHQAEIAALADPRPATVTLAHFVKRGLGADIAAGRCTVTCVHRLFASAPRLTVTNVRYIPGNGRPFIIVTDTGDEWQTHFGGEQLAVTWHDPARVDAWTQLSPAMRNALRFLAGDGGRKPRPNTLSALTKRRLVRKGKIVRAALALYRNHQGEFAHV